MKVTVTRHGGFAGITRTWTVDIDELADAADWHELIDSLPWGSRDGAPQPDRFVYAVDCNRRSAVIPEEHLTDDWRRLIDLVQGRPERRPHDS